MPSAGGAIAGMRTVLDGARTPELIPDEQAIRVLVLNLARTDDWEDPAIRTRLASLGLSAADLAVLTQELTRLRSLLLGFEAEAKSAASVAPRTTDSAERVRAAVRGLSASALGTYQTVLDRVSPDGRAHLEAYLAREKRNIRILAPAAPAAR
jgi:hypothetical protein